MNGYSINTPINILIIGRVDFSQIFPIIKMSNVHISEKKYHIFLNTKLRMEKSDVFKDKSGHYFIKYRLSFNDL